MTMHTPLRHLFPRSAHPATTRGHTLAAPRFYELFADVFFLGRRRATFEHLIIAAGVQPGQRILDVACGTVTSHACSLVWSVRQVDSSPRRAGTISNSTSLTPLWARLCRWSSMFAGSGRKIPTASFAGDRSSAVLTRAHQM
jgi:hypothetical protein